MLQLQDDHTTRILVGIQVACILVSSCHHRKIVDPGLKVNLITIPKSKVAIIRHKMHEIKAQRAAAKDAGALVISSYN